MSRATGGRLPAPGSPLMSRQPTPGAAAGRAAPSRAPPPHAPPNGTRAGIPLRTPLRTPLQGRADAGGPSTAGARRRAADHGPAAGTEGPLPARRRRTRLPGTRVPPPADPVPGKGPALSSPLALPRPPDLLPPPAGATRRSGHPAATVEASDHRRGAGGPQRSRVPWTNRDFPPSRGTCGATWTSAPGAHPWPCCPTGGCPKGARRCGWAGAASSSPSGWTTARAGPASIVAEQSVEDGAARRAGSWAGSAWCTVSRAGSPPARLTEGPAGCVPGAVSGRRRSCGCAVPRRGRRKGSRREPGRSPS